MFSTDNNDIKIIENCNQIKLENKQYLLSEYREYNTTDCLQTTNLFRNNKINAYMQFIFKDIGLKLIVNLGFAAQQLK